MTDSDSDYSRYQEYRDELEEFLKRADRKLSEADDIHSVQQDADERLLSMFLLHIDEYKHRLDEIGGFGIGGIEADLDFPWEGGGTRLDTDEKQLKHQLGMSVRDYWSSASMSYLRGNFRGCIFESATMTESGLRLIIIERELESDLETYLDDGNATLGRIIQFLNRENVLDSAMMESVSRVNKLRKEHIHQLIERDPTEEDRITDRDEFVRLDEFEGNPPVRIRDGYLTGDGVNFVTSAEHGQGLLYKYKADAKTTLDHSRRVLTEFFPRD